MSVSLIGASFASVSWSSDVWLRDSASPVAALTRSSQPRLRLLDERELLGCGPRARARSRERAQRKTAPPPASNPRMRNAAAIEPTNDRAAVGRQKNQPRRVRRPTGAECRIRRLRRATGSDAGNLAASDGGVNGARARNVAMSEHFRAHERRDGGREHPFAPYAAAAMDDGFRLPAARSTRALPEFEPRPEQAALAAAVERALAFGEHLVAEAGTGVGKSLAYLVPALESGQRVVVATATKALQEQLLGKDVPIAASGDRARRRRRGAEGPRELPLPPPAAGLPAVPASRRPRRRGLGGDAGLARRDRDGRPGGARARALGRRSGASCRSAPTAARAGAVPSSPRASPRRPASAPRMPIS